MKNNLLVREAVLQDVSAIASVHYRSWQETYQELLPAKVLENLSQEKLYTQWSEALISKSIHSTCFVAEYAGEIVGFIHCGPQRKEELALQGEYDALYVLACAQRLGIGSALFEHATHFLQQYFKVQSLWVLKSNTPARSFYEKHHGVAAQTALFQLGEVSVEKTLYIWEK